MLFGKKPTESGVANMVDEEAPVQEALILVCEKCGKQMATDGSDNPARSLQQALKERIKNAGMRESFRAVTTSCMDICPPKKIAVGILNTSRTHGKPRFFTVDGDVAATADLIMAKLKDTV